MKSAFELLRDLLQPAVDLPSRLQRLLPTVGTLHQLHGPVALLTPGLVSLLAGLRGLAQVIFINNPLSGLVLLLAFLVQSPWCALLALLGTAASHCTARLLGLAEALRSEGIYGFNGALVGCAVANLAQFDRPLSSLIWAVLVMLGGALTTLLLEGLGRGINRSLGLPPLTLPFILLLGACWGWLRLRRRRHWRWPNRSRCPSWPAPPRPSPMGCSDPRVRFFSAQTPGAACWC